MLPAFRKRIRALLLSRARCNRASCRLALCLILGLALPTALPARAEPPDHFTTATPGYRFEFPKDHGAHPAYRTEWWYYTGHLQATDGRTFGFELTFFRRALPPEEVKTLPSRWSVTQLYLAHFAITDIKAHRFHFSEKLSRAALGKAGADESRLHVWIDDWQATASSTTAGGQTLEAQDHGYALSLTLEPAKPVVIHGLDGISRKGADAGQASHYYSLTRLAATGRLRIGAESFDVTGTGWMDHEFGSAELGTDFVGWDWLSIQLADKTELMLYRLRRRDGSSDPMSSGTMVFPDGDTRHLALEDFQIETKGFWTSANSKATYPSQWRIAIPSLDLTLEVTPLLADQELRTSRSTQVTYWEGAVTVSGTKQGGSIKGQGYVELTGYDKHITNKL
jgi:predicted secreted hydrolase